MSASGIIAPHVMFMYSQVGYSGGVIPDTLPSISVGHLIAAYGPLAGTQPCFKHLTSAIVKALCHLDAMCTHQLAEVRKHSLAALYGVGSVTFRWDSCCVCRRLLWTTCSSCPKPRKCSWAASTGDRPLTPSHGTLIRVVSRHCHVFRSDSWCALVFPRDWCSESDEQLLQRTKLIGQSASNMLQALLIRPDAGEPQLGLFLLIDSTKYVS